MPRGEKLIPFKKGDPRINRTGLNRGHRSLVVMLREALEDVDKKTGLPQNTLLIRKMLHMAIKQGNEQIISLCWKYLERIPMQETDIKLSVTESAFNDKQLADIARRILNGNKQGKESSD